MNDDIKELILKHSNKSKLIELEVIQKLWSGYGELSRIKLDDEQYILKLINLKQINTHPKGWNSDYSHQRKLQSYATEVNWYTRYNKTISNAYSPECIVGIYTDDYCFIILEDLELKGYKSLQELGQFQIINALSWLANFHANYLNERPKGIWQQGSYWNLDTRPHEFEALTDQKIKYAAPKIDSILCQANFQTVIHGDAKYANFMFNANDACAVDFQYVGGGAGIKDVVLFFSSLFNEDELEQNADKYLNLYFEQLKKAIDSSTGALVEKEWRELYKYAWFDYYRFLTGWSPEHSRINAYSEMMKDKALYALKQN